VAVKSKGKLELVSLANARSLPQMGKTRLLNGNVPWDFEWPQESDITAPPKDSKPIRVVAINYIKSVAVEYCLAGI